MRLQQDPLRTTVPSRHLPVLHRLPVFLSGDFRVIDGVNEGDGLSDATDLVYEDVYALTDRAAPVPLGLETDNSSGPFRVSRTSPAGRSDAPVFLDSLLAFIGPTGGAREVLVFVEVDIDGTIAEVYLHPLAPLVPGRGYALVTIDRLGARNRLKQTGKGAFTDAPWRPPAGTAPWPSDDLRPVMGY